MKRSLGCLPLLVCFASLLFPGVAHADSITSILRESPDSVYEDIVETAKAIATSGGLAYGSTTKDESKTFEGDYTPQEEMMLAIFSDDGCNVSINSVTVLSKKGSGQHLPDLSQSLYKIGGMLSAGQEYHIKVEYSNTIYGGGSDIDGVTLFAYSPDVVWDVYTPIGEDDGMGDDTGGIGGQSVASAVTPLTPLNPPIQGGFITKPQDQTKSPAVPAQVFAAAGQNILCAVTTATDKDRKVRGSKTSYPLDGTLTYKWSAKNSAGVVVAGFTSASGQSTTWKAPEEAGTYTLTCTIDDVWTVTNTGLGKNEKGQRNDTPVNRSVTVTVTVRKYQVFGVGTTGEDKKLFPNTSNNPNESTYVVALKNPNDYVIAEAFIERVPYDGAVGENELLPDTVKWSAGEPVPGKGQRFRRFSKSIANKVEAEISIGSSKHTFVIYVMWATGAFSNSHYPNNNGDPIPNHPNGLAGPNPETGVYNSYCEIQFTIQPNSFIKDGMPGPQQKFVQDGDIFWKVEREKKAKYWTRVGDTWGAYQNLWGTYQDTSQAWVPDVYSELARDLNPWDDNGAGNLYGMDTPGFGSALELSSYTGFVAKFNGREFAQVKFGNEPGKEFLICSDYLPWRAFRAIKRENGVWSQDSTYGNEIVEGNLFWGTVPTVQPAQ